MTRRLIASYLALAVLMLVVLGVPFGVALARREKDALRTDLERDAVVLSTQVEDALTAAFGADPSVAAPTARSVVDAYGERTGARVVVVDATGALVADNEPPIEGARSFASRPEIQAALAGRVAQVTRDSRTLGYRALFVAVPVASSGKILGAVRVSYPLRDVDREVRRQLLGVGGVGLVALLLAAIVAVVLARWVARPVARLRAATRAFGDGALETRAPTGQGPPELRQLGRDFNHMADRLVDLVTSQDAFVADASHQLRSPLAALRLRLEAAELASPDGVTRHLAAAHADVLRLSRTVDGLLALARPDRSAAPAAPAEIVALLEARIEAWGPLASERGVGLELDAPAPLRANVDADRLSQVLDNLLANALDAAPPATTVRLVARSGAGGEGVLFHVVDQGPGMTAEQRARAFDRFWRGGRDRTELGGTGLGLAIVRKLVQADGGSVELREAPGGGLDAVVGYPPA